MQEKMGKKEKKALHNIMFTENWRLSKANPTKQKCSTKTFDYIHFLFCNGSKDSWNSQKWSFGVLILFV